MNLNEIIAKSKGWKCYEMSMGQYRLQYIYEPGRFPWDMTRDKEALKADCVEIELSQIDRGKLDGANKVPDYLNDPRLYMQLFEAMEHPELGKIGLRWYCMPATDRTQKYCESDTIGAAICEAYCKLKGLV